MIISDSLALTLIYIFDAQGMSLKDFVIHSWLAAFTGYLFAEVGASA